MIIKAKPEDFIVEEVTRRYGKLDYFRKYEPINLEREDKHLICVLKKRNVETFQFIKSFSKYLGFSTNRISLSGTKDKVACTIQLMSIYKIKKEKLKKIQEFKYEGVELYPLEYSDKKIHLGEHEGNFFTITIRKLRERDVKKLFSLPSTILFPNYYGVQRFGEGKIKSWEVGRALLRREWREAVKLILENALNQKIDFESEEFFNLTFSKSKFYERNLYNYLLHHHGGDFLGGLKSLPRSILQMFVHSYQSWLFNKVVEEFSDEVKEKEIHIPGYNFEGFIEEGKIEKRIREVLLEDGISPSDFYIKELGIKSEGLVRKAYAQATDFRIIRKERDGLFPGYYKVKVSFFLPAGSYATVFLKEVLK